MIHLPGNGKPLYCILPGSNCGYCWFVTLFTHVVVCSATSQLAGCAYESKEKIKGEVAVRENSGPETESQLRVVQIPKGQGVAVGEVQEGSNHLNRANSSSSSKPAQEESEFEVPRTPGQQYEAALPQSTKLSRQHVVEILDSHGAWDSVEACAFVDDGRPSTVALSQEASRAFKRLLGRSATEWRGLEKIKYESPFRFGPRRGCAIFEVLPKQITLEFDDDTRIVWDIPEAAKLLDVATHASEESLKSDLEHFLINANRENDIP